MFVRLHSFSLFFFHLKMDGSNPIAPPVFYPHMQAFSPQYGTTLQTVALPTNVLVTHPEGLKTPTYRLRGNWVLLTPLYMYDNLDRLWRCEISYTNGECLTINGIVALKNGQSGKEKETLRKNIRPNGRSPTALDAAREYAEGKWREKQIVDRYFPREVCP